MGEEREKRKGKRGMRQGREKGKQEDGVRGDGGEGRPYMGKTREKNYRPLHKEIYYFLIPEIL